MTCSFATILYPTTVSVRHGKRHAKPPQNATDSGLSIRELEAQITELAGHLNAANHRWLVLIAEFDRRNGWSDGFTQSCAHWLSWKCGLDLGCGPREGPGRPGARGLPQIADGDESRRAELLEGARAHARGDAGDRGRVAQCRVARHLASRRDAGAAVSPRAGSGGAVARGAAVLAAAAHVFPRPGRLAGREAAAAGRERVRCC